MIFALQNDIMYRQLFDIFDKAYKSSVPLLEWWNKEINGSLNNISN